MHTPLDDLHETYDVMSPPMQAFAEIMALTMIGALSEVGHRSIDAQVILTFQVAAEMERALALEECPPAEFNANAARNVSEGTALGLAGLAAMVRRRDQVSLPSTLPMVERPLLFALGGGLLHRPWCTRVEGLEMATVARVKGLIDSDALPLPCECVMEVAP